MKNYFVGLILAVSFLIVANVRADLTALMGTNGLDSLFIVKITGTTASAAVSMNGQKPDRADRTKTETWQEYTPLAVITQPCPNRRRLQCRDLVWQDWVWYRRAGGSS